MAPHPSCCTIAELTDEELPPIAELPGDLRQIAETLSPFCVDEKKTVRGVLTLSETLQGTQIYLPCLIILLCKIRNRRIRAEYNRGDISGQRLARKYRLSYRSFWNIVKGTE